MAEEYKRNSLSKKLVELLAQIDFGRRYFDLYAESSEREGAADCHVDRKDIDAALDDAGLEFKYLAKEQFFRHVDKQDGYDLLLHAAFPYCTAEFGLYVKGAWGAVGGPWPKLARQVVQLSRPDFNPSPASPKLPFSDAAGLREAVRFATTLYGEARDVITSFDGWNDGK